MNRKQHIHIVEDNEDHRELLEDALKADYILSNSDTAEKCLRLLQDQSIDLIILDYYLNNSFSGIDILKGILKIKNDLPVIIVTAYGDEDIAVDAIKCGATDYIRKTMDNSYIDKIYINVKKLLSGTQKENSGFQYFINFIETRKEEFLDIWNNKINKMCEYLDLGGCDIEITILKNLFLSFVSDIQNESSTETLKILKELVLQRDKEGKYLINIELINTSFKEAARDILYKHYPKAFDYRDTFMQKIGKLVDHNDLELSKTFEKIVDQSILRMRSAERLSTKFVLLRTLQHEIRQPLSYIYNSAEMLLTGLFDDNRTEMIEKILDKSKEIEKMLSKLETNSDLSLKNYSDNLPIIDLSKK